MGNHVMFEYLRQNPEIDVEALANIYIYFKFRAYLQVTLFQTQKAFNIKMWKAGLRLYYMPPDELCKLSDLIAGATDIPNPISEFESAIKTLAPAQAEVIKLYFYDDKTDAEIASDKHVTRQAVNNIKRRALENLKKYFNDNA